MSSSCARRSPLSYTLTALLCGLLVSMTSTAHAHGGNPLPRQVHTFEDGSWMLMTNFGVMTSDQPTRYICEEIYLGGINYRTIPFDTQHWLTISSDQLARTTDGGCTFERLAERDIEPAAVAHKGELVAWLTNDPQGQSVLTWSQDRADTLETIDLSALGAIQWTGLHITESGTLHLSGYSEDMETRGQARMFSVDIQAPGEILEVEGWEGVRYPYIFDEREGRIAGIANVDGALALLWDTLEQAPTTSIALESWPVDMSLSEDGMRLAVAGATATGAGMLYERDPESDAISSAELFGDDPSACIAWLGPQQVTFCARSSAQDFALAQGTLGGSMMSTTLVDFEQLEGPIQGCAADSALQKSCALVWPELQRALRIDQPDEPDLDMGADSRDQGSTLDMSPDMTPAPTPEDMAPTSEMEPSPINDEESSCSQSGLSHKNDNGPIYLILLGFIFGAWRRKATS